MRIIAGTLGGRRILSVPGRTTRPTTDRVREALFSRLGSRYRLADADVLDLFAGTGALGIEALSRGAGRVVAVERNRRAARALIANLQELQLAGRAEVLVREVGAALEILAKQGRVFQGVFVDPPYRSGLAEGALRDLARLGLVAEGGWVSVEVASSDALPESVARLVRVREDVYGDTKLVLYELAAVNG